MRRLLPVLGIVVGLALVAYPVLTDMWFARDTDEAIEAMRVMASEGEDVRELFLQAHAYDAVLASEVPEIPYDEIWPYERQLAAGSPYMSWVEIPDIAVRLPVYHGTSDSVLAQGAGHVENTSLPVGSLVGNCVVSAHSGFRTARMFDDVSRLHAGSKVCLHTLGETFAYEFVSSEVVLPEEVDHLGIYDMGHPDMLTLVTCTPYGVNDHRLLVHMSRCEYVPEDFETSPMSSYFNVRTVPLLIAGALVTASAVLAMARARMRESREA